MSVLSYCLVSSTKISRVISASIGKRSSPFLIWKKELAALGSTHIDRHGVFTVPKRTLIKKRQLIGSSGSSHMKPDYKKDKIGPEFEFIYCSSNIQLYFWWTPVIFILIISVLALCGKIVVDKFWYGKELENVEVTRIKWIDTIDPMDSAITASLLMLGILISVLRYLGTVIVRLYYNKSTNEFVAVMLKYGVYRKKVYFKPSDVVRIEKRQLKGNVKIKGIPVTVSEQNFTSTPAYNLFMGYSASRPSVLKDQLDKEDLAKTLETIKEVMEKQRKEEFLEKYKEKRKQRQRKNR
ncbi:uncharacterized protein LOC128557815 [Mercenaria mercenaria]|uniref:uncharacterized protein LOC128557815 n=1 Tax=Mercenaria mercenaria TaxID=6596 RepID=UPI00234F45C4|nr:uncharacterized protein LOC128557815 [Mercenaria mercenaria]